MLIFCSFFNFDNKKVHLGVVKTHANPYFSESLSYNLSYESKFGSYIKKMRGTEFFWLMKHKCRPYLEYCHTLICIDRTFSKILYICKPHWWVHIYLYLSFHRQQGGHRYIFIKCTSFYPNPRNIVAVAWGVEGPNIRPVC